MIFLSGNENIEELKEKFNTLQKQYVELEKKFENMKQDKLKYEDYVMRTKISKDKIREKIENYKAYKGTVLYEKYGYEAIILLLENLLKE